jgi:FlaG/FlaF family flagellin (archaellin)
MKNKKLVIAVIAIAAIIIILLALPRSVVSTQQKEIVPESQPVEVAEEQDQLPERPY